MFHNGHAVVWWACTKAAIQFRQDYFTDRRAFIHYLATVAFGALRRHGWVAHLGLQKDQVEGSCAAKAHTPLSYGPIFFSTNEQSASWGGGGGGWS